MTINSRPMGLYIHYPFCERKCHYCGFYSVPVEEKNRDYVGWLLEELHGRRNAVGSDGCCIDTVFLGGGTPSLMKPAELIQLFEGIRREWKVEPDAEITVECNPNSLTDEFLDACAKAGVTRISMGVQAFDDAVLSTLGRIHRAEQAMMQIERIRSTSDLSIDLMFGVPGQTMDQWEDTLEQTLRLAPDHISCYSLQMEEGTPFYEAYRRGELSGAEDELERAMHHRAIQMLGEAGYQQYEISNFARPGKNCRHNEKYWNMEEFIGIGPSSAGCVRTIKDNEEKTKHVNGNGREAADTWIRYENPADLLKWQEAVGFGELPGAGKGENLPVEPPEDSMAIYCFTALRTRKGIRFDRFRELFDGDFWSVYDGIRSELMGYQKKGWLTIGREAIALTEAGIDHSNEIMCEFLEI